MWGRTVQVQASDDLQPDAEALAAALGVRVLAIATLH
jgi:hypothetical protein